MNGNPYLNFATSSGLMDQSIPDASSHLSSDNAYNSHAYQYSDAHKHSNADTAQNRQPHSQHVELQNSGEAEDRDPSTNRGKDIETGSPINYVSTPYSPLDSSCHPHLLSPGSLSGPSEVAWNDNTSRWHSVSSSRTGMPRSKSSQTSPQSAMLPPSTETESALKLQRNDSHALSTANTIGSFDAEPAMSKKDLTSKPRASAKASHSLVERKYRHNLNTKMDLLGETIALTRLFKVDTDNNDKASLGKLPKAEVLNRAMRYVQRAELEIAMRMKEVEVLRAKVVAYEKHLHCRDWVHTPLIAADIPTLGSYHHQQCPPLPFSEPFSAHGSDAKPP